MALRIALLYLVAYTLFNCFWICWYHSPFTLPLILVVFLKNWYLRRRQNQDWSRGVGGISRTDFLRLVLTVLSVVLFYLPLSLYVLSVEVNVHFYPFVWSNVHGPLWKFIVKAPSPTGRAAWPSWIGILLAITLFFFVGFTRNAKQSYEHCIEWIYDHSPSKLQAKAGGMRKLSDKCKDRRATQRALANGEGQVLQAVRAYNPFFDISLTGVVNQIKGAVQRIGLMLNTMMNRIQYIRARQRSKIERTMKESPCSRGTNHSILPQIKQKSLPVQGRSLA